MKIVLGLLFLFTNISFGKETDNEARIYDKCYMMLVSEVPRQDDPFLRRIEQKSLKGADACVKLLSFANFVDGKVIEKVSSVTDMDQKAFEGSLYSYLRKNSCQNCHRATHGQPHSSDNIAQALSSAKTLVNLNSPKDSRFVTKILSGHQCGANCATIAQGLETEISNWKNDLSYFQNYLYQSQYGYYNKLGSDILRSMTNFHRKWFNVDNFYNIHGVPGASVHVHDMNENAYYFLRAIFSDLPLSSVLTTDYSLEAERYSSVPLLTSIFTERKRNDEVWTDIPYAPRGRLVGVDKKVDYIKTDSKVPVWSDYQYIKPGLPFNYTGNLGGGIIGTQSYILYNMIPDKMDRDPADGALHMFRRWSEALFANVLCRPLPVVREVDAVEYVNPQSSLPFRNGAACMQCHSSMDPVASSIRNLTPTKASSGILVAHQYEATLPPHPMEVGETNGVKNWIDSADKDFWKREPNGHFYFRDYKGFLHDKTVSDGLSGLGKVISETDDFYLCSAKRYVNFFTGVDIPLFDPDFSNPATPKLTAKEQEYYNFIQKLALELKQHQDVRKVFERIFRSQAFLSPGKGVE